VIKHLEPFSTYAPSSRFAIKLVIMELSEPAPGSVRQNDARSGFSTKGRRNRSFCWSVPCWLITTLARSLHIADVAIPVSPYEISLMISADENTSISNPFTDSGIHRLMMPIFQAVSIIVQGNL